MGISQTMYIIKKYEDYNPDQLLMSNFVYKAWKEAESREFKGYIDIEEHLDEIAAMQDLIPIYEMDDMNNEERPTLCEMSYFGKNPVVFSLVKKKIESRGLELKERKYIELLLEDVIEISEKCKEFSENNPDDLGIKNAIYELNELIEYFKEENPEDYFILYSFS